MNRIAITLRLWVYFLVGASFTSVAGQHTEAACNITGLQWSFNSLGQSPCLVAAYLSNPCYDNGNYDVPLLGAKNIFYTPGFATACTCNTVVYNLLGACSACQGSIIGKWSVYSQSCDQFPQTDGQYPRAIPAGTTDHDPTVVPNWAYQKVFSSDLFDLDLARRIGDSPESATFLATTSSLSPVPSSANPLPSSSPSSSSTNNPSISSSPAPPSSSVSSLFSPFSSITVITVFATPLSSSAAQSDGIPIKSTTAIVVGGVIGGVGLFGGILTLWLIWKKKQGKRGVFDPLAPTPYPNNANSEVVQHTSSHPMPSVPPKTGEMFTAPNSSTYPLPSSHSESDSLIIDSFRLNVREDPSATPPPYDV